MYKILSIAFILLISGCSSGEPTRIGGTTMGTTWEVILPTVDKQESKALERKIMVELEDINKVFSTYDKSSLISHFNQWRSTRPFMVSPEFITVLRAAKQIHLQSERQFDPTLAPIIRLWGFGSELRLIKPKTEVVRQTLAVVGFDKIQFAYKVNQLIKLNPDVELNLSAIAKGYAVDKISEILNKQGISDYLVEVGGELKAKGMNAKNHWWKVAIAKPQVGKQEVQHGLELHNQAVATSGDYQNFFIDHGQRYSHTFDVKTGYPVINNIASVTVIHYSAMWADGYATALLAMGEEKGLALAKQLGLETYFIIREKDHFKTYSTLRSVP